MKQKHNFSPKRKMCINSDKPNLLQDVAKGKVEENDSIKERCIKLGLNPATYVLLEGKDTLPQDDKEDWEKKKEIIGNALKLVNCNSPQNPPTPNQILSALWDVLYKTEEYAISKTRQECETEKEVLKLIIRERGKFEDDQEIYIKNLESHLRGYQQAKQDEREKLNNELEKISGIQDCLLIVGQLEKVEGRLKLIKLMEIVRKERENQIRATAFEEVREWLEEFVRNKEIRKEFDKKFKQEMK